MMPVEEVAVSGDLFVSAREHWDRLRETDHEIPRRHALDPLDIPPRLLRHTELIEVLRDPLDFRYRLIGTEIDRISAQSYTGLTVREIPSQAPPSRMFDFLALAVERGAPLCARLPYVGPHQDVRSVRNLLLPLGDTARAVSIFWSVVEIGRRELPLVPSVM